MAILLLWFYLFVLCIEVKIFVLFDPYVRFLNFISVGVTEWPPIENSCSLGTYTLISGYKCIIVSLVFPASVLGVRLFLIIAIFFTLFSIICCEATAVLEDATLCAIHARRDYYNQKVLLS